VHELNLQCVSVALEVVSGQRFSIFHFPFEICHLGQKLVESSSIGKQQMTNNDKSQMENGKYLATDH
jgi:hypothetical protein